MRVKDFDDFSYPKRRPWLLIVVLAIVAAAVWQRYRAEKPHRPEPETEGGETTVVAEAGNATAEQVAAVRPPAAVSDLLAEARRARDDQNWEAARERYGQAWRMLPEGPQRDRVENELGDINVRLAMSGAPMAEKVEYVVKSGDYMERIARQFGTTIELIQISNEIANPNVIKKGDRLRVLKGAFRIVADKQRNVLRLYHDDMFFARYPIGTGKLDKTPEGTFVISEKIKEPTWWRPDGREVPYGTPENILGTRWMTLRATGETPDVRGYGIHGTWDDATIGKAESAGCIRMKNTDVEALFAMVPVGTPVEIRDR